MRDNFERNRLRYAGRIPQETLDYLASKKRSPQLWQIVMIPIVTFELVLLVMLLFVRHKTINPLFICVPIFMFADTLRRLIRSWVV